jgi:Na+-translocating ferredoxin:NAD+ oxidoreductase RNF subunit RnfB
MTPLGNIAVAATFMAGLGTLLAVLLAAAQKHLYVAEDPRIDAVDELLPHANCGACGTPGCRAFAEALVQGRLDPGQCTVASIAERQAIADYLGVSVVAHEKRVPRLACAGGSHVARQRATYDGLATCRAAHVVGGGKGCTWGCLGFGDCVAACEFDALTLDTHGLPVVREDACIACGDCVDACPRRLYSLQPVSHQLWVACSNQGAGADEEAQCEVICNACGRCVADAPAGLISLRQHLAVIDYQYNALATRTPIERCPTGAIVWWDHERGATKGAQAVKILRREPAARGTTHAQPA